MFIGKIVSLRNIFRYTIIVFAFCLFFISESNAEIKYANVFCVQQDSSTINKLSPFHNIKKRVGKDTLKYNFLDDEDSKVYGSKVHSPLYMKDPANVVSTIIYDPVSGNYILKKTIGSMNYRRPIVMTKEQYEQYKLESSVRDYWMERNNTENLSDDARVRRKVFGGVFDKIFGSDKITIIPQGSAELTLGISTVEIENPTLPENLRKTTNFNFDEKIQMNVSGSIGEKLKMEINYNTEATFDFENEMKLEYAGDEDEIIKKIEAGNVSMPLSNTLITGGQSLFGLKTKLQFGKLAVTSVFSQQKGESSVVNLEKGAQKNDFEISAGKYEANRHYFLSKYFRDSYDKSLRNLPIINSGVNITKLEVWITNKTANFQEARNIVAFVDLGESSDNISNSTLFQQTGSGKYPYNELNNLYSQVETTLSGIRDINKVTKTLSALGPDFFASVDYEKLENARKLSPRDYILNTKLGYISLNSSLNADEVLSVAYEYTFRGEVFQVGEFTSDGLSAPNSLVTKMIKSTNLSPKLPTWDLMMKNIYNIGAYQVKKEDFVLNVLYQDDKAGTQLNYLSVGNIANKILLQVLNLDNLNSQLDPNADGSFDFIDGVTVYSNKGRVIFPVLEPFGSYLKSKIANPAVDEKYVFSELYTKSQNEALQLAAKNKYIIKGSYKSSSSSEISLNALNIQPGSVHVSVGGRELMENIDYTVDYTLGSVKIINQALLESGEPIKISSENNSMFSIQTKTLIGTHLDYDFNKDFTLGATIMHLSERPLTQKVNIGDEPISNTMLGFNGSYRTESGFITRMIDKLPFIETKEKSTITVEGEFAKLMPGHNSAIGSSGTAYIDDFEGTETAIDMKSRLAWVMASTPQGQKGNNEFPEAELNDDISYGFNRAKLSWYVIDPLMLRNTSGTPAHIKGDKEERSNHFVREIFEEEIWPNRDRATGIPSNIPVLNLAFYPKERGAYNYDVDASKYSRGVNPDGSLVDPSSRWGGIMRRVQTNDFEAANIEYIEFWVMDPFVYDKDHKGGDLYFNLGSVSEDVLRDSRKSFENGLPSTSEVSLVDSTAWGRVPRIQSLVNAFNNSNNARKYQDLGLDGLNTEDERTFFSKSFLEKIANSVNLGTSSQAYSQALIDPSSDDYHYFRGGDYDAVELGILDRYKKFNGPEGNSPTASLSKESYPTSATSLPDLEDINKDNTLSETEAYYQYKIHLSPENMVVGKNYIVDKVDAIVDLPNGEKGEVSWFQYKVPVRAHQKIIGNINDFTSIRFMRLFMKGFEEKTILRFATLDLVRSDWRKYTKVLDQKTNINYNPQSPFEVSSVNIEENSNKTPVNYVLPTGISRVVDPSNPQIIQLNEQSIVLKVDELEENDARAVYKTINMDIRQYGRMVMDVHAEAVGDSFLDDNEVTAFIRVGSDYTDNYYEYELSLKLTPAGVYSNSIESQRLEVWPLENKFDFSLKLFQKIKQLRNTASRAGKLEFSDRWGMSVASLDNSNDPDLMDNYVYVKGNPNMSNVKTIMLGIRNKKDNSDTSIEANKSVEVWMNELRLTDFDEEGGWAANLRITTKLADLGTVTMAGSKMTSGFGGIEQSVMERNQNDISQYDISTSLELGRFFPEKSGVRIPLYYAISERFENPKYDPLDPDIPLEVSLDNAESKYARDSIKKMAQNYTKRTSFNLTNVRIEKTNSKQKMLDISNLALTYSYNKSYSRNVNTVRNLEKNYRALLSYNYTNRPKNIVPFKNVKFLRKPIFKIIKDFNFYYMPVLLSFRSDMTRYYHEIQSRNIDQPKVELAATYDKDFTWNRYYDMKFNFTKSLKFDFSATNTARIDEPDGIVDRDRDRDSYHHWKDSVWNNILDGGRAVKYHHNFNVTYTLPINKIPLLNWTSASARYSGIYDWDAGPITADTLNLGNTIRNSSNMQLTAQLNLVNLYNKIGFLKKINRNSSRRRKYKSRSNKSQTVKYEETITIINKGKPVSVFHKLSTKDVSVKVYNMLGKQVKAKVKVSSGNRVKIICSRTIKGARVRISGTVEQKENPMIAIGETFMRILMGVRNISLNYSEIKSTTVPGYLPGTNFFGGERYNGSKAPGLPFLLGYQDENFANKAAQKGWITTDKTFNDAFTFTNTQNFTLRSSVEPIKGLRIDFTANRNYTENTSEFYIYDSDKSKFNVENRRNTGNLSMSFMAIKSAFFTINNEQEKSSKYFLEFLDERKNYSLYFAKKHYGEDYKEQELLVAEGKNKGEATGYYKGYGETSQDVMIPAFLKAYGGGSPSTKLIPTLLKLRPNWRVSFRGLSKVPWIKRYFKSVNLSHAYNCTYTVGGFATNSKYEENNGFSSSLDKQNNFRPLYEANSVSINEQFNPLINISMIWRNNLSTRFELKRTRSVILGLSNAQLSEVASNELIFGLGYRFDNFGMIIGSGKKQKKFKSDLNLRGDFSIRKNMSIIRKINDGVSQLTQGQKVMTLKLSADYVLSNRFNLRLYYDRIVNDPYVSLSYLTTTTEFGASVRFTLTQ